MGQNPAYRSSPPRFFYRSTEFPFRYLPREVFDFVEQDDGNPCPIALHQNPIVFNRHLVRFNVKF